MGVMEWVGIAVSGLLGVGGFVSGLVGNRRAQQANKLAQAANRIAESAVSRADEANQIAGHANELSEESNSIVRRQSAQQEEDWFVEWKEQWETKPAILTLVNRGRDSARHVSVTIAGDSVHRVVERNDDILPGEKVVLTLPELLEERRAFYETSRARTARMAAKGITTWGGRFQAELKVTVRWRTGEGVAKQQIFELQLS